MKKHNNISFILFLVILISSLKITGCEQEDLDIYIDCDYCLESIPDSSELIIYLTINEENPSIPLEFFLGDYEDEQVDWIDTAYTDTLYLRAEVGKAYSVKAKYKVDGETLTAVDGDKIRIVNGEDECGPPCYYITAGTLDVRIKE